MNKNTCSKDNNCDSAKVFAYLALLYIITCIVYYILSRNAGTPFGDALKNYPQLLEIKQLSSNKRMNIFIIGIIVGIIILLIFRPFNIYVNYKSRSLDLS